MSKLFHVAVLAGSSMLGFSSTAVSQDGRSRMPQMKRELPSRSMNLDALRRTEYDVLIIGGGAVGAGCALDAATRGLKTALVEADDFGSGTSSKSSKLLHGGLRDLDQAIAHLDGAAFRRVHSSLKERSNIANLAPHLNQPVPIMLPLHHWWQTPIYWAKLHLYHLMAPGPTKGFHYINSREALELFPMMRRELFGAFIFYEGQHDDARMCLAVVLTAARYGADVCNHMKVIDLLRDKQNMVVGAKAVDQLTGKSYKIRAKIVINATGPLSDAISRLEDAEATPQCIPSWASHLVLPHYYCPEQVGLFDPHPGHGSAIFFLPWLGHTLMGTAGERRDPMEGPHPTEMEVQYLLDGIRHYINPNFDVRRCDVLAVWGGYKPLPIESAELADSSLRNHVISLGPGKMISIVGATWTSFRLIAEQAIDAAIRIGGLEPLRLNSITAKCCKLDGAIGWSPNMFIRLVQDFGLERDVAKHLSDTYGSNAFKVAVCANSCGGSWPIVGKRLHTEFPYIEVEVRQGVKDYACTLVDMVARRLRVAFLNVQVAEEILPRLANEMAQQLNWSKKRKATEIREARKFLNTQMGHSPAYEPAHLSIPIKLTVNQVQKYAELFRNLDENNTGFVSISKSCAAMKSFGVKEIPVDLMHNVLRDIDCHAPGKVNLYEFLLLMSAIVHGDTAYLHYARMSLDQKHSAISHRRRGRFEIPVARSGGGL
ncbi:glycerol-3-phosphate dehydrogenase, mitochondrial [Drosophila grimshawi]|uniref:Glycerol-3-phosphate dehydrogenase n=1 Tax=Drosophila grimshawi TaxID=7222 RepID=B4J6Y7_DROGR|nr:glycerol-3-phosphate dehydrogenase, mitochondrial [Drosophila grimshawi]EDW02068.1 GH20102 [Drosophila grimshawi]